MTKQATIKDVREWAKRDLSALIEIDLVSLDTYDVAGDVYLAIHARGRQYSVEVFPGSAEHPEGILRWFNDASGPLTSKTWGIVVDELLREIHDHLVQLRHYHYTQGDKADDEEKLIGKIRAPHVGLPVAAQ